MAVRAPSLLADHRPSARSPNGAHARYCPRGGNGDPVGGGWAGDGRLADPRGLVAGTRGRVRASILTLSIFFHPWLILGIAIDAALLLAVLVSGWQPSRRGPVTTAPRPRGAAARSGWSAWVFFARSRTRASPSTGGRKADAIRGLPELPPPCRPFEGSSTRVVLDGRSVHLIGSSGSSNIERSRSSGVTTPIGAPSSPTTTNRWM